MEVADDKAMHPEKNCWNEKRFPELVKQLREKAKNGSSVNTEQTFANLAIGNNTVEHESCYVAVDSVGAQLAQDWFIDSGCTISMITQSSRTSSSLLKTMRRYQFKVMVNSHSLVKMEELMNHESPSRSPNCLQSSRWARLHRKRCFLIAQGISATLKTPDGSIILQASLRNNLLHCSILPAEGVSSFQTSATCLLTQAAIIPQAVWSCEFGKDERHAGW